MARTPDRQSQWRARLARWRKSGLSIRRFCFDEGVSEPSFFSWRRRLLSDGNGDASIEHRQVSPVPGAMFLPMEVIDGGSSVDRASVEIRLPSGATLRLPSGIEEARVRTLLRVLREECS